MAFFPSFRKKGGVLVSNGASETPGGDVGHPLKLSGSNNDSNILSSSGSIGSGSGRRSKESPRGGIWGRKRSLPVRSKSTGGELPPLEDVIVTLDGRGSDGSERWRVGGGGGGGGGGSDTTSPSGQRTLNETRRLDRMDAFAVRSHSEDKEGGGEGGGGSVRGGESQREREGEGEGVVLDFREDMPDWALGKRRSGNVAPNVTKLFMPINSQSKIDLGKEVERKLKLRDSEVVRDWGTEEKSERDRGREREEVGERPVLRKKEVTLMDWSLEIEKSGQVKRVGHDGRSSHDGSDGNGSAGEAAGGSGRERERERRVYGLRDFAREGSGNGLVSVPVYSSFDNENGIENLTSPKILDERSLKTEEECEHSRDQFGIRSNRREHRYPGFWGKIADSSDRMSLDAADNSSQSYVRAREIGERERRESEWSGRGFRDPQPGNRTTSSTQSPILSANHSPTRNNGNSNNNNILSPSPSLPPPSPPYSPPPIQNDAIFSSRSIHMGDRSSFGNSMNSINSSHTPPIYSPNPHSSDESGEHSPARGGEEVNVGHSREMPPLHLKVPPRNPASSFLGSPHSHLSQPSTPRDPQDKWWIKFAKPIGQGGFGTVYKCQNKLTGEFFVAKQVPLDDPSGQCLLQLQKERELLERLSKLSHPNIVHYIGSEMDEDYLYIFLEYVENGSIRDVLRAAGPGTYPEALIRTYTRQILHGLRYLHGEGVLHRDIKGSNCLVDSKGNVKLADFGLARDVVPSEMTSGRGTIWWTAPEVLNDKFQGYGTEVDIWSLGCTVLEMASGVLPWFDPVTKMPVWKEIAQERAYWKIAHAEGPPPVPEHLSEEMKAFIRRCCDIDPTKRPTAGELLNDPFIRAGESAEQIMDRSYAGLYPPPRIRIPERPSPRVVLGGSLDLLSRGSPEGSLRSSQPNSSRGSPSEASSLTTTTTTTTTIDEQNLEFSNQRAPFGNPQQEYSNQRGLPPGNQQEYANQRGLPPGNQQEYTNQRVPPGSQQQWSGGGRPFPLSPNHRTSQSAVENPSQRGTVRGGPTWEGYDEGALLMYGRGPPVVILPYGHHAHHVYMGPSAVWSNGSQYEAYPMMSPNGTVTAGAPSVMLGRVPFYDGGGSGSASPMQQSVPRYGTERGAANRAHGMGVPPAQYGAGMGVRYLESPNGLIRTFSDGLSESSGSMGGRMGNPKNSKSSLQPSPQNSRGGSRHSSRPTSPGRHDHVYVA